MPVRASYNRAVKTQLSIACALAFSWTAGASGNVQDAQQQRHAEQRAAIRQDAAAAAEARADELDAIAARLSRLAEEVAGAAAEAREKAVGARADAERARRRSNEAAASLRRALGQVTDDGVPLGRVPAIEPVPAEATPGEAGELASGEVTPLRRGRPFETDKHAAMTRTAEENKGVYLPRLLAEHQKGPERAALVESLVFAPGQAPDMGDLDVRGRWQWSINVARGGATFDGAEPGSVAKTGNIDLARLTIRPDPASEASVGMNWGMRRYNLGDVTVVDCDFVGIPKEHGIYDNLSGHGLYQRNTFLDLGGQAIQLAHRDKAYAQYPADNLAFTGSPVVIFEGNQVVDCGRDPSRSGFTFTFFDIGTHEHPSTIVLRDCTVVHAWDQARTQNGRPVDGTAGGALRSPGGLVVHQYQHVNPSSGTYPVDAFVVDNSLFDLTQGMNPVMAIRGAKMILLEDSCFLARNHRRPVITIDDEPDRPSGTVVLENCVSPEPNRVWLEIRGRRVRHVHCPGKRVTINVKTLEVTESEMQDDPITRVISPLEGRTVRRGSHPQPAGHVDDIGDVVLRFAEGG